MLQTRTWASLIVAGVAACAQSTSITGLRVWSQPEVTRVVVEFTAEFKYQHGRVGGPERVYIDFSDTSLRMASTPEKRYSTTQIKDNFVHRVRAAESQPGQTRLVFDLALEQAEYSISEIANPPRLVVEFRGSGKKPAAPTPPPVALPSPGPTAATPPPPAAPRITIDQMRREADRAAETGKITPPPASSPMNAKPASPAMDAASKTVSETASTPLIPAPTMALPARRPSHSMTRALGLKLGKIVLDPGHGGHDFGTSSPKGLHEKDIVLDVAKRLGALLEDQLGAEVIYTRTEDTFIPLEKRTAFANSEHADLFVSIHANSSRLKSVWGPETFFLNFSTSQEAMEVAARENATSEKTIYELQDLLKKIALNEKVAESREFAADVQESMITLAASMGSGKARDRGVKRAPFVVLIGAQMPSILAEIGFLTNKREEALLAKPAHRQKIAAALAKGIAKYAGSLSRFQLASSTVSAGSGTNGR